MRHLSAVLLTLVTSWAASGQTYYISTAAGGGLPVNIQGTTASLYGPRSVAVDKTGNVFFVDLYSVLRWDAATRVVSLVAGNGTPGFSGDDGPATNAQFSFGATYFSGGGLAVDPSGNLYIADTGNNRVRRVSDGVITTVAGNGLQEYSGDNGPASSAGLASPVGIAVDTAGNLYIADTNDGHIRKVSNGLITTVAGGGTALGDNGPAIGAGLASPEGLAVDSAGNLYIADYNHNRIRKVSNGVITTVAGNGTQGFSGDSGPAISAELNNPEDVAVDSAGNVYVADYANRIIRKISNGVITTLAGNGGCCSGGDNGPATSASLGLPAGVAADTAGNLYIADTLGIRIRKVSNAVVTTVVGNGMQGFSGDNGRAISAQLNKPSNAAVDPAGNLYLVDYANNRIRKVANGIITTVAGNGTLGFSGDGGPATSAQLNGPAGIAVDAAGDLYISDNGNNRIRKVSEGAMTTVAGNGMQGFSGDGGLATRAELNYPQGLAVDSAGNLYFADTQNNRIRKVSDAVITTVAGNGTYGFGGDDGPAASAELSYPGAVAVDAAGSLYISDAVRIRKVSGGVITTVAGNGTSGFSGDNGPATAAGLYASSVSADSAGNLYISDSVNFRIRKVSNGIIATIAGGGSSFGDNGPGPSAALYYPGGVAVDASGNNVYLADPTNERIRALKLNAVPVANQGGVVPVYSSVPAVQSGSWISIYGANLASGTFLWNGDFPTSLGGVSVTIDNNQAYLWVVTPTQINVQVPDDSTTGLVSVSVTTGTGTATSTVTLAAYGPSFSLLGDGKHAVGEIVTPNGTGAYGGGTYDLVGPSNTFSYNTRPVKAGETLTLYGVGFGPTTPHVSAGQIFSGAASTNTPVTITIGGVKANVSFAGITEAGLYQFNLVVPPNTGSGDQALQATVNGVQTPSGSVVTVQ